VKTRKFWKALKGNSAISEILLPSCVLIPLLVACALVVGGYLYDRSSAFAASPCEGVDETRIMQHIPLPEVTLVSKKVLNNTCEVIVKVMNEYVPLYVYDDYVIAGDMFKDKKHITQQSMDEAQQRNTSELKNDLSDVVAFSYKPSQSGADKYIYMFTDPECQHCELAKYQVRDFAEKRQIEVRVILYPLPMHEGAKEKAIQALCSHMDYSAYLEDQYSGRQCKEGEEKISKSLKIGEALQINGTPTFIGPNGKRALGFDAKHLEEIL
jgi:thiol:disulfide interchange protein DsbC